MKRRSAPLLTVIGAWHPETYLLATLDGAVKETGRAHAGLGISQLWRGSPKGRRPPAWSVTHLGSGYRVCIIEAHEAAAFAIADRIAALTAWDFDGPEGWRNRDPDLLERFAAFVGLHPEITHAGGPAGGGSQVAREIAMARAS